jgi:hypothetical protein
MHNIKLDIPDITVVIEKGSEYLSTVTPSEVYQVLVNTGDNYNVVVDNHDIIVTNNSGSYLTVADYASTASYALVAQSLAAGGSIVYDTISASNAYFGNLTVSQSIRANLFTGSFVGNLVGTSSWATSASYVPPSGLPSGVVSSSSQVSYTGLSNVPSGIVSSSAQVSYTGLANIPVNIVSGSTQIVALGFATTGSNSFNGNQTITGSLIQGLEGNIATGENSHAEGSITKAIGNYSHAEGDNTQAKGDYSHAEGQETIASGSYSHAEGYQTIALANHQHVQGQFNAVSSIPAAFIVGNGTDDGNRSNLIYAAGNEVQITGSLNVTTSITGSSFVGKLATTQIAVTTATASISTIISSSVKRGIFSATEQIEPYIPSDVFSGVSIEYNAQRIGSVRSGFILASWSGSDISFTDVSNADVGETYDLSFNFIKVGSDIILRANSLGSGSGDWTVQFLFKMFPKLL